MKLKTQQEILMRGYQRKVLDHIFKPLISLKNRPEKQQINNQNLKKAMKKLAANGITKPNQNDAFFIKFILGPEEWDEFTKLVKPEAI